MEHCSICLGKTRKNRMNTPCGHTFHGRCISRWTGEQGKNTCPMCRAPGMRSAVYSRITNTEERLYEAILEFEEVVRGAPEMGTPLPRGVFPYFRVLELQVPTSERIFHRAVLRSIFLVRHKPIQDAFMNVMILKRELETKAFNANAFSEQFMYSPTIQFVNILKDVINLEGALLVHPEANKTLVKPDFKYLKKLITKLFYHGDCTEITQELINKRKAWKKQMV